MFLSLVRILAVFAVLAVLASVPASAVILRGGGSGTAPQICTGTANQIAACQTARSNPTCGSVLGDYYVAIANATTVLWSYFSGSSIGYYTLTQMDSGTKPIDAAFWVQYRGGVNNLTADDVLHLHQQSGFVNMPANCSGSGTVLSCLAETPGVGGPGSASCSPYTNNPIQGLAIPSTGYGIQCNLNVGLFTYNGANFQSHGGIDGYATFYNSGRYALASVVNTELQTRTFAATISSSSSTWSNTGNNGLVAGMHVYLTTPPTGFSDFCSGGPPSCTGSGQVYYVTNVAGAPTSTSFQLSTAKGSYSNGVYTGGTAVPAGGSGSATVTVMPFTYSMPLLAGGGNQSAAGAIQFLQAVIAPSAPLLYGAALGAYPVVTNYGASIPCGQPSNGEPPGGTAGNYIGQSVWNGSTIPSAFSLTTVTSGTTIGSSGPNGPWIASGISQTNSTCVGGSPIPANYLYATGCWKESDPFAGGDNSCSGIGSKGFYLAVDPTKTYVEVLVRNGATGSGYKSNLCAANLRYAYINATPVYTTYPP